IYYHQYPNGLPHNGRGVKYAKYMCRTMAFLPDDRREQWLDRHAPWLDGATRDYIMRLGPYWYSATSLGNRLELYDDNPQRCGAWSMEAIDVSEEQRRMINKEKNRQAQERRRRKNGAKPQTQSERRTKPWEAMGISESTYRRRKKKRDSISSRPSLILGTNDELLSSTLSQPQGPKPAPGASVADDRNQPDPGIIPGGIRERALAFLSLPMPAAPRKPVVRDRFPADNVIEFPIRKRDADM